MYNILNVSVQQNVRICACLSSLSLRFDVLEICCHNRICEPPSSFQNIHILSFHINIKIIQRLASHLFLVHVFTYTSHNSKISLLSLYIKYQVQLSMTTMIEPHTQHTTKILNKYWKPLNLSQSLLYLPLLRSLINVFTYILTIPKSLSSLSL